MLKQLNIFKVGIIIFRIVLSNESDSVNVHLKFVKGCRSSLFSKRRQCRHTTV